MGVACPGRGCQGRLVQEYPDKALYDQLKFFQTLFDVDRAQTKVRDILLFCVCRFFLKVRLTGRWRTTVYPKRSSSSSSCGAWSRQRIRMTTGRAAPRGPLCSPFLMQWFDLPRCPPPDDETTHTYLCGMFVSAPTGVSASHRVVSHRIASSSTSPTPPPSPSFRPLLLRSVGLNFGRGLSCLPVRLLGHPARPLVSLPAMRCFWSSSYRLCSLTQLAPLLSFFFCFIRCPSCSTSRPRISPCPPSTGRSCPWWAAASRTTCRAAVTTGSGRACGHRSSRRTRCLARLSPRDC